VKIYCNRENRAKLKGLGVVLIAKPLGRPKAVQNHIRPGERNPIEGKFGQAKTAYGMNRIKARLQQTSESWIATIIMVLNLVKLTGLVSYCLAMKILTYSAWCLNMLNQESLKWMQQMEKNFELKKGLLIQQTLTKVIVVLARMKRLWTSNYPCASTYNL
jgi:hypothetical protein